MYAQSNIWEDTQLSGGAITTTSEECICGKRREPVSFNDGTHAGFMCRTCGSFVNSIQFPSPDYWNEVDEDTLDDIEQMLVIGGRYDIQLRRLPANAPTREEDY